MTIPILIGFGGRKRAGKDAAAEVLEHQFEFHRESISVSIDLAAREINPIIEYRNGQPVPYNRYIDDICRGDFTLAKEHVEVRRFLEQIGAFGRSIDPSVWLDRAEERVVDTMSTGRSFALTGLRFTNEIEMVRRHRGLTVWVSRPGHEDTSATTVTETSVGPEDFDFVIVNDGSLAELSTRVLDLLAWT